MRTSSRGYLTKYKTNSNKEVGLFIIFGSRGRIVLKDTGQFFCPQCCNVTDYQYYKAARYFTLFFIPLFPYEHLADYIKCQRCEGDFTTAALNNSPETMVVGEIISGSLSNLHLQIIKNSLISKGFKQEYVTQLIEQAGKDHGLLICSSCKSEYLYNFADEKQCSFCNSEIDCLIYPEIRIDDRELSRMKRNYSEK